MKVSTEISSATRIVGERKAIEMLAKAGFDAMDLSLAYLAKCDWSVSPPTMLKHPLNSSEYVKYVKEIKKIAEDNGLKINQSHAPIPTFIAQIRDSFKRSIECSAIAGAEICVIHPDNNYTAEQNADMYGALLPFAKECGVKIATENMYSWDPQNKCALPAACSSPESFLEHINAVNDPYFVACLDIGHAAMKGVNATPVDMIKTLGNKIEALHIHDNNGITDGHYIPGSGVVDFKGVVKALKDVNYKGYFTLEADAHVNDCNEENIFVAIKELYNSVRKLADDFESL